MIKQYTLLFELEDEDVNQIERFDYLFLTPKEETPKETSSQYYDENENVEDEEDEGYGEDYGIPKPEVEFWTQQEDQTLIEFQEIMSNRVTEDVKINWKLWKELESIFETYLGVI